MRLLDANANQGHKSQNSDDEEKFYQLFRISIRKIVIWNYKSFAVVQFLDKSHLVLESVVDNYRDPGAHLQIHMLNHRAAL